MKCVYQRLANTLSLLVKQHRHWKNSETRSELLVHLYKQYRRIIYFENNKGLFFQKRISYTLNQIIGEAIARPSVANAIWRYLI